MSAPWRPLVMSGMLPRFLAPVVTHAREMTHTALGWSLGAARGMKIRSSVKRLCEDCRVVKRRGVVFVYCDRNPKHKQRQG